MGPDAFFVESVKHEWIAALRIKNNLACQADCFISFRDRLEIHAEILRGDVTDGKYGGSCVINAEGFFLAILQIAELSATLTADIQFAVYIAI